MNSASNERTDFSVFSSQLLDRAMPPPVVMTVALVVATAERQALAAVVGGVFVATNVALNVTIAKLLAAGRHPRFLLGPGRSLVTALLLPPLVWAGGGASPAWLVTIPALFALPFFFRSAISVVPSLWVVLGCCVAIYLDTGLDLRLAYAAVAMAAMVMLAYPMVTALRRKNEALQDALDDLRRTKERAEAAREEAERLRAKAEESSLVKAQFLANMSHEIRTPMNAVIGMTGLLLDTRLDAEQREFVGTVRESGEALLAILNDVLDFSKIEANQVVVEDAVFDLRGCLESSLDLVAERAASKRIELACCIDPAVPETAWGDVTRVRQVLANLLSNAVKFTEKGEVLLSVGIEASEGERCVLRFEVRDTGIGIPPDRMDRLFQSFSQVDASTTRKYGGTGLGLAISKRLVELMGGQVSVASEPGRGSTFGFTLPVRRGPPRRPAYLDLEQPALRGRRLLVVDDNATNREILRRQAAAWGMTVEEAASGAEALALLRRGRVYDVVVVDMLMPEMDGLELGRKIRELDPDLPLMMLTSVGWRPPERQIAIFAAFVTKPIKASALYEKMVQILAADVRAPATPVPAVRLQPLAPRLARRILLAEDHLINQKVAIRLLERLGYRPDIAANGLEVMEALRRQAYDVVLMDVQMPEMNGLQAAAAIRAEFSPDRQPYIVAITANATVQDRAECLEAGMDDYVAKPFRAEEVVAALERSATRTPGAPRAEPGTRLAAPALEELRGLFEGQPPSAFAAFLDESLASMKAMMGGLQAALAAGRADEVARGTHQLAPVAKTFGALGLARAAGELEAHAKSGTLLEAGQVYARVVEEYAAAAAALQALRRELVP